jgi:hypothetical protein
MKTTHKFLGLFCAALTCLLAPLQAAQAAVAGQVQFTNGKVQITTVTGVTKPLQKGDTINEGDAVITALASSAQIKMKDGGFVAVRPETHMKFDKFVFNGKQDGSELSYFSLIKGGFRAVTGLIGQTHKQNYKITTTTATIGIRGTDHETFVVPEGNALALAGAYSKVNVGETTMTTNRGTINVLPNQMGYSSGMNEAPKLAPINTSIFTVSAAPTKTIKENKDEKNSKQAAKDDGAGYTGNKDAKTDQTDSAAADKLADKQDAAPATAGTGGGSGKAAAVVAVDTTAIRTDMADTSSLTTLVTTGTSSTVPTQVATPQIAAIQQVVPITLVDTSGKTINTSTQTVTTSTGVTAAVINCVTNPTAASCSSGAPATPSVAVALIPNPYNAVAFSMIDATGAFTIYNNGWPNNMSGLSTNFNLAAPSPNYSLNWSSSDFNNQKFNAVTNTDNGNANSFASTGIQFGRYTNISTITQSWGSAFDTLVLNGNNNGSRSGLWAYGVAGYLDTLTTMLTTNTNGGTTGVFNYVLDGTQSAPLGTNNQKGLLTSFTLSANFSTNTISANLSSTIGTLQGTTEYWTASDTNMNISGNLFGNNYGGIPTQSVSRGIGATTVTTCTTCSVFVSGGFTGQNYSGIVSTYHLYDSSTLTGVDGVAALTSIGVLGNATITNNPNNSTPSPTNGYFVANSGAGFGGGNSLNLQNTLTNTAGVLTQWGNSGTGYSSSYTVTCSTCVAGTTSATTGIVYGTWDTGNSAATFSGTYTGSQVAWISGPPVNPFYLPQVLTGTANYVLDGGTLPINLAGTTGTLNSASLAVNFTQQVVALNLGLSVAGNSWMASASNMPLTSPNGQGNTNNAFYSSASYPLTVSMTGVNGTVTGSGSVAGQLTGNALNGALFQYQLTATAAAVIDSVTGVAALALTPGASLNTATPYQLIATSWAAAGSATSPMQTNGTWNNQSQVTQDATGNVTGFNTNGSGGANNAASAAIGAAVATNTGSDPISGISWGRWQGPGWTSTNLVTGVVSTHNYTSVSTGLNQPSSLHWIAGPAMTGPVSLPISGTFTYTLAGGTNPTDNSGNVGTLNSASLVANFTAQTVNVGVNATVNSVNYVATGSNLPIVNTVFGNNNGGGTFTATENGVATTGNVGGSFTGATGNGALVVYGFLNGATATVVNGVAAFHR